jgi:uncharacterized protein YjbI with pentapeptide repeats
MSGADLAYARLDQANLTSADLKEAFIDYADFKGAVLTDTNLCGVNLQHVRNLTQAQINRSLCDVATVLPAYLENPVSPLKLVHEAKGDGPHKSSFINKTI